MTIIGHCQDGYHSYCGGELRDRGDGSWIQCECRCHGGVTGLACPDCGVITNDGELCGECLSEKASYFVPEEDK